MAGEHGLDDKELDDLLEDTLGEFSDEITARPGCFHSLRPRHESPRNCRHTYPQSVLVQPHAARAPGTDVVEQGAVLEVSFTAVRLDVARCMYTRAP